MPGDTSENLYHVLLTSIDLKKDPSGAAQDVSIKATFTSLPSAKAFSRTLLTSLGYERDFFTTYDELGSYTGDWPHGDGVQVYAAVAESEILKVELKTAENKFGYQGDESGRVTRELWHVVQTTIHYNLDRSGAKRDSVIEGSYETAEQARQSARTALLDEDVRKEDFAEYDEFGGTQGDWTWGEDVVVHAVGQGGENYVVRVLQAGGK